VDHRGIGTRAVPVRRERAAGSAPERLAERRLGASRLEALGKNAGEERREGLGPAREATSLRQGGERTDERPAEERMVHLDVPVTSEQAQASRPNLQIAKPQQPAEPPAPAEWLRRGLGGERRSDLRLGSRGEPLQLDLVLRRHAPPFQGTWGQGQPEAQEVTRRGPHLAGEEEA